MADNRLFASRHANAATGYLMPRKGDAARKRRGPETVLTKVDEVAQRAGVSVVTVSRAFNRSPLVTEKTRARVLEAAREVGYRPNSAARALRQRRTNSVAVVLKDHHLFGQFHSEMIGGIHSVVSQRELSVVLAIAPVHGDIADWLRELVSAASFDAIVLHQQIAYEVGPELVERLPIPVVIAGLFLHPVSSRLKLNIVGFDHTAAIQQAVRHLVALGHRSIAYFDNPGIIERPTARESAFRAELQANGLEVREQWVLINEGGEEDAQAGAVAIQQLYGQPAPYPTAILCAVDLLAFSALNAAKAWGRRVPDDLSIIGYENSPFSEVAVPALTTVHQRGWDLGVVLGEKLLVCQDDRSQCTGTVSLPMRLIVRQSTAPPGGHK
jgi:LacI family transcriptional regulator